MAINKRICLIASDEEDEDGNFSEDEVSMGEGDEEYVVEGNSESSSAISESDEYENPSEGNSKSSLAKSKTSVEGEVVCLPEDSSSFQHEDEDETEEFDGKNTRSKKPIGKNTPIQKRIIKNKSNLKTKKVTRKRIKKKITDDDDIDTTGSDDDIDTTGSDDDTYTLKKKWLFNKSPLADAILIQITGLNEKGEPIKGKSQHPIKLIDYYKNLIMVNKVVPTEENKTDLTISDPLLVVKEDGEIKLEIKEEIDIEHNEDIKIKGDPTDLLDIDECKKILKKDKNLVEDREARQSDIQNKRKAMKRTTEDQDDPSFFPKTKKKFTTNDIQNDIILTRKRGRAPKNQVLPLTERNKESENNLLSDKHVRSEKIASLSEAVVLSEAGATQRTMTNLRPTELLISSGSNNTQPTSPKKRGRTLKIGAVSTPTAHVNRSAINHSSDVFTGQTHDHPQLQQNAAVVKLEYIPEMLLNSLLKTYVSGTPTVKDEKVFDNTNLSCLQQLDTPGNSSLTVQMTGSMSVQETNSFVADYLISHQSVFDKSFFQNILPALSEILMLCMNKFTELLVRNRKSENVTSAELRQQEVKFAMQSFCTIVSTYSEKFFPNFNSVMYKIDQNKTKKGLIIAFLFFITNSLWIKAPKFKGQIHTIRKMLMCMCQIRNINSPLFLAVLTTPENIFNDELRLLVKILLVLQNKNVLTIPTTALPEASSNNSTEEMCEVFMSSVSDSTSPQQQDFQKLEEVLDNILCMFKQKNSHGKNSETSETSTFESGVSHSFTQQDTSLVMAESLEQDQKEGLESLIESFLKSTSDNNDGVKMELDDDENAVMSSLRSPTPDDDTDMVKVEEKVDCASFLEGADQRDPLA